MKTKPWPIIILSWLYILAPIPNIAVACWLQQISPIVYFTAFINEKMWLELFSVLFLFPLVGLSIFAFKKWSYPVFLLASAFALYLNYQTWTEFPTSFPLHLMLLAYFFNIAVVGYFMIPAVRAAYFDPRLRWWESQPRYAVDFETVIVKKEGFRSKGKVLNISTGGVFIVTSDTLEPDEEVQVAFHAYEISIEVSCKVIHSERKVMVGAISDKGYGLQFIELKQSKQTQANISKLIATLKKNGVELLMPRATNKIEDFKEWIRTLFTTGKGLVPKVVQRDEQKKQ